MQSQSTEMHKINAIKVEQTMQSLEHSIYEMQGDTARMSGQMMTSSMKK